MWRWRNRKLSDLKNKSVGRAGRTTASPVRAVSRRRIWLLRLIAAAVLPLLFFILFELGLHLAGYGYSPAFLLPDLRNGQKVFVQNNRFGWRFFGWRLARWSYPFTIPQAKAPDTVRIFVFGESAAYGDPEPRYGLARMLQAMLSLHHPGVRFEVVNAGMTAINSHVILPIARDCATANGDIWVIYMGNNAASATPPAHPRQPRPQGHAHGAIAGFIAPMAAKAAAQTERMERHGNVPAATGVAG